MFVRPLGSLFLFSLFLPTCTAQLATTDDGAQIAFSTTWRLRGESTTQGQTSIYRRNGSSWSAVTRSDGNSSQVIRPFLSGDGSVIGWERYTFCNGSCLFLFPRSRFEFEGLAQPLQISDFLLTMSRNARYILRPSRLGLSDFSLQDLDSGLSWTYPTAPRLTAFDVANNGTVIGLSASRDTGFTTALEPFRVVVWRPGAESRELMRTEKTVWGAWLSADASKALVELIAGRESPRELWWIDIETGNQIRIAQQLPNGSINFLDQTRRSVANHGNRVLFWWPSEVNRLWLWDAATAGPRVVFESPEGLSDAVISGDGRVIWVMTRAGRLLRLDPDNAGVEQVLDALPQRLRATNGGTVAGSATTLSGSGASPGLRFTVNDLEFPVVDASQPDNITIQIPWQMADRVTANYTTFPLLVRREGHPFELQVDFYVEPGVRPVLALFDSEKGLLKAALPDFSALVSDQNPALVGSTIHTWLFGLGPLDHPVPTGVAAPSDPPSAPLAWVGCYLQGRDGVPAARGLELPFIAYAPGLIGVIKWTSRYPRIGRPAFTS